ncbi:hypothetical protein [Bacteroides sp. 519]|uniref:hypothetical protein n=1 Tax=Bacteroides sp. 519 TaxID=2302937 RepID=UPI0013D0C08D|nr:hypothetical protein [Bacteroides sp. 519]NDV57130.1 hypothetical protein [Bacteroides sp. 519]
MKALLPVFCRPMGYIVLLVSVFLPFILYMQGLVTDQNLVFYLECTKLLMMAGSLLILLALSKNESLEIERIRIKAMRNAVFLTFIFIFFAMLYRVAKGGIQNFDSDSFVIFLIINVLCLEFEMKKNMVDKAFKK